MPQYLSLFDGTFTKWAISGPSADIISSAAHCSKNALTFRMSCYMASSVVYYRTLLLPTSLCFLLWKTYIYKCDLCIKADRPSNWPFYLLSIIATLYTEPRELPYNPEIHPARNSPKYSSLPSPSLSKLWCLSRQSDTASLSFNPLDFIRSISVQVLYKKDHIRQRPESFVAMLPDLSQFGIVSVTVRPYSPHCTNSK